MTLDILFDPLPPVSFGDTITTPLECHVLFELPLIVITLNRLFGNGIRNITLSERKQYQNDHIMKMLTLTK